MLIRRNWNTHNPQASRGGAGDAAAASRAGCGPIWCHFDAKRLEPTPRRADAQTQRVRLRASQASSAWEAREFGLSTARNSQQRALLYFQTSQRREPIELKPHKHKCSPRKLATRPHRNAHLNTGRKHEVGARCATPRAGPRHEQSRRQHHPKHGGHRRIVVVRGGSAGEDSHLIEKAAPTQTADRFRFRCKRS